MRIAVTGASGFIGARIARALRADGHDVRPFGRREAGHLRDPLPGYRAWDLVKGAIDLHDAEVLVHCGAAVGQWGDPAHYHAVNVTGTHHALGSLRPGTRVVYVSTASVYAKGAGRPLTEDATIDAASLGAYGRTKAEAERVVLRGAREAVVLRPHVVYGPGDTTLWPRVLAARRLGRLLVPGSGGNPISTTHVDNLIDAVRLALRPGAATGVFNIADAHTPDVDTLLRTIFARKHEPVRLTYVPRLAAWGAASALEAVWALARKRSEPPLTRYAVASLAEACTLDLTRARTRLGYAPRWDIRDGPL